MRAGRGLIDEEERAILRSFGGKVDEIFFIAVAKDRPLCPDYYSEPKRFARIVVDFTSNVFDEYLDLAFADDKARLDNFAIYLQNQERKWKG